MDGQKDEQIDKWTEGQTDKSWLSFSRWMIGKTD